MPIVRKVMTVGGSRGVTLPSTWLSLAEEECGRKITRVSIEIDEVLTIKPILSKKETTK